MAYCTQADLVDRLSEAGLVYLADDDGDESVSIEEESVVDSAIEAAAAEIDAALQRHVWLPVEEPNEWLRDRAVDLAAERLAARKGQVVPVSLSEAAKRSRDWLERVRLGSLRVPGLEYAVDGDERRHEAGLPRVVNPERENRERPPGVTRTR